MKLLFWGGELITALSYEKLPFGSGGEAEACVLTTADLAFESLAQYLMHSRH